MSVQIQQRRGTASEWSTANPILAQGEFGVEIGSPYKLKVGDGATAWNALAYLNTGGGSGAVDSVNGQTGTVVLDADDISDAATAKKFATAAEKSKLAGIEALADVTDATNVAAAGAAMKANNLSDLASAGTARVNLGLGTFAEKSSIQVTHDEYISMPADAVQGNFSQIWRAPRAGTLVEYAAQVDTAPTAASIIFDLNKNGTSVDAATQSNRATITTGSTFDASGTPATTAIAAGDQFQFQLDQLNATDDGAIGIITLRITWKETIT